MTAPRPLRLMQLTVRGWLALVLWIMGTTVLIGALVGAVLLHRTDQVSRQVADGVGRRGSRRPGCRRRCGTRKPACAAT